MPQITLSRKEVLELLSFTEKHNLNDFFMAKDHGAYVGASAGDKGNCIFYFAGCDPRKDKDFWENSSEKFGGDDFGEMLPVDWLRRVQRDPTIDKMVIKVTKKSIAAEFFKAEPAKA
jgi:hypothetical protein